MTTRKAPTIAVLGLWHLGCVTAGSLAQEEFDVWGFDPGSDVIANLQQGRPPIFEPGLAELIAAGQRAGSLKFTASCQEALRHADVVWVTYDTPVDDADRADVTFVQQQLDAAFPFIKSGTIVIISSQVPVGFTNALQEQWRARDPQKNLVFCYSPENLRLGKALDSFHARDRIVAGLDDAQGREVLLSILGKFCARLEWMSVRSAEMTKHALNAFLAVSVAMANEIARICERTGADAKEVERGLKSESRVGPEAYLSPGSPFAGGTLARDLQFLVQLGDGTGVATPLLSGALQSNNRHKEWLRETVMAALREVSGRPRVALLGVTYKPGTDTLRRSEALSLGLWLAEQGNDVVFHDPMVRQLSEEFAGLCQLTGSLEDALAGADLVVVCTGWPAYREEVNMEMLRKTMRRAAVIDPNRFLAALDGQPGIFYFAVGKPGNAVS